MAAWGLVFAVVLASGAAVAQDGGSGQTAEDRAQPGDESEERRGSEEGHASTEGEDPDEILVLTYELSETPGTDAKTLKQAMKVVRRRMEALEATKGAVVRKVDDKKFEVRLPGSSEELRDRATDLVGRTARLSFRKIDDEGAEAFFTGLEEKFPSDTFELRRPHASYVTVTHPSRQKLEAFLEKHGDDDHVIGYEHVRGGASYLASTGGESVPAHWRSYYVLKAGGIRGEHVKDVQVVVDQRSHRPMVLIELTQKGAQKFGAMTKRLVDKRLAIMVDNEVKSAPVVNEPIPGGRVQIALGTMKSFDELARESKDLAAALRSGALPAPVRLVEQKVVSSDKTESDAK